MGSLIPDEPVRFEPHGPVELELLELEEAKKAVDEQSFSRTGKCAPDPYSPFSKGTKTPPTAFVHRPSSERFPPGSA
jgi:hypothetical protein